MKALSLRLRLTLLTVAVIAVIALLLTLVSMYNADSALQNLAANIIDLSTSDSSTGESTSETEANPGQDLASATTEAQSEAGQGFRQTSILMMLLISILGGLAAYWILGYALRPLSVLTNKISKLTAHELDSRLTDFQAGDEINQLADAFNQMLARLQATFESQKRFAGAAAHELKTPLAIIKTNADVLRLLPTPQLNDYQEVIKVTEDQTARMITLVDDLLAISHEETLELNEQVFLLDLLQEIVAELQPLAAEKHLRFNLTGESEHQLTCNPGILQRALANIIENAIKYNVAGGAIDITVWEEPHKSLIRINDTGIGIPADTAERIFEPFYRVDTSRSRKTAGAGLGLAIARDNIQRHGGSLTYHPHEYGGSSFTVELPRLAEH